MELKKHYENLWYKALHKFKQGAFEYDHLIDSKSDKRFGISLIARPCANVKANVQKMFTELRKLEPHQYYYPASDIHITILTIISSYQDFSLSSIQPSKYVKIIKDALANKKPFNIHFKGITASPSCILLQGFPANDELHHIRTRLRDLFAHTDLEESIDNRYSIVTAHSTVIRFRHKIADGSALIAKLKEYRDFDFGSCCINEFELVYDDWYQRKERGKSLHTFMLQAAKHKQLEI